MTDALTKNAAFAGALAGSIGGQTNDANGADYANSVTFCLAWAVEFDTQLTAAGTVGANASRGQLAFAIAYGLFANAPINNLGATGVPGAVPPNPATSANYLALANAAVAIYGASVASLV